MSEQRSSGGMGSGFSDFTLAELTLIQQGLWRIGEEDAVDHRLVADWRRLLARLRPIVQQKVAEIMAEGKR